MNTFNLTLDLAKAKQRQQQTIFARQGDKNATTIVATITDHGAAANTSGMTARFQMRLPNGTEYYRKTATLSGNVATVTIDETQAASAVGRTDVAYFQLLQGSTVVASTESFTVVVLPDALADADVAESYDSAIQDAIDALDAAVADMPDMVEDVLTAHPEWTTTVQDGSVSDAKLYQGTDGILARVGRLQYRLANMLTNALPEGEAATATDAAMTPVAGLALYGRSTQAGTPTPSAPVPIVSVGAANLLPNTASTQTINGVTFIVNADGSVTVTGTATARTDFVLASGITFDGGTYTVSGTPSATGTGDWNVRLDMTESPYTNYLYDNGYTSGNRATGTIPAGVPMNAAIRVYAGKSPNVTFKPMLNAGSTAYPYVPYGNVGLWAKRTSDASEQTVTPIDLQGHELRSLPDGTRDELTVGADGHAVLVQRVGSVTLDGSSDENWALSGSSIFSTAINTLVLAPASNNTVAPLVCSHLVPTTSNNLYNGSVSEGVAISTTKGIRLSVYGSETTAANTTAWLAENPTTLIYKLATPVTIDLGTVAAVPLVGPDLTAQAVPTAPFALTYERDLNATLARLESAIATLA